MSIFHNESVELVAVAMAKMASKSSLVAGLIFIVECSVKEALTQGLFLAEADGNVLGGSYEDAV
jgi:hypothetical protein